MNTTSMTGFSEKPRSRHDGRLYAASAVLWIGSFLGARAALEGDAIQGPLRIAVALAPVAFFVVFLLFQFRAIRGMDELERRIQLEALAFAFPALLVLLLTLGLLQVAGVALSPEDWSYRHVWALAFLLYMAGLALATRRYR